MRIIKNSIFFALRKIFFFSLFVKRELLTEGKFFEEKKIEKRKKLTRKNNLGD